MIKHDVSLDQIQLYLSNGIILHPTLNTLYIQKLLELNRKGKCTLLPSTILELYSLQYQSRIAA